MNLEDALAGNYGEEMRLLAEQAVDRAIEQVTRMLVVNDGAAIDPPHKFATGGPVSPKVKRGSL